MKFAFWVPLAVILGGLAAGVIGFFLKRVNSKYGWTLLIVGPVAALVAGPGMFNDHLIVDDDHFELQTGFWFSPKVHNVKFADIVEIEIKDEQNGRNRSTSMFCKSKNGTVDKVPVGDLMKQGAMDRIIERAQKQGFQKRGRAKNELSSK